MKYQHTPVMLNEVLEYLDPRPGQNYIDCTLGGAGYTLAIAKKIMAAGRGEPDGKILSIDLDQTAIANGKKLIEKYQYKNIILANENFNNLSQVVKKYFKTDKITEFSGIIFDLGLSSAQLQDRTRGFSFQVDGPLNMNFSKTADGSKQTAEYIVNNWSEKDLWEIIKKYGEEGFAKNITDKIIKIRKASPIKTTNQLVEIIEQAVPKKYQHSHIHPATRTFQALRIATNDELNNLITALPQALNLLRNGGKMAIISYHSLEDRIVKLFFKTEEKECICPSFYPACRCLHKPRLKILTRHVLRPTQKEIISNPRSRSAKLRIAQKI